MRTRSKDNIPEIRLRENESIEEFIGRVREGINNNKDRNVVVIGPPLSGKTKLINELIKGTDFENHIHVLHNKENSEEIREIFDKLENERGIVLEARDYWWDYWSRMYKIKYKKEIETSNLKRGIMLILRRIKNMEEYVPEWKGKIIKIRYEPTETHFREIIENIVERENVDTLMESIKFEWGNTRTYALPITENEIKNLLEKK